MNPFNPIRLTALIVLPALLLGGCGTAPPAPPPQQESTALSTWNPPSRLLPGQAHDITLYAIGLVGTPYRFGGNTPNSGFDCSGLIGHVYMTSARVAPPRTVSNLNRWGQLVSKNQVQTGDLVFFSQSDVATHAGIYVGEDRFVHAPSTGGEVRLDSLNSKYWASQQVSFRRP